MAIFARRRLASMLDDLAPLLTPAKCRDLVARLEHERTDQAMASEAELGLLWALAQTAEIEIEPRLPQCPGVPDALAFGLIPGRRAVVEITALSDDTMSGELVMRRAASILSREASRLRRKSGSKLHFTFHEVMGYEGSGFCRRRRVTESFQVDDVLRARLATWLNGWPASRSSALRLINADIDVTVEYNEHVHRLFNFFCTMPPVTYSLTDNTLYKALETKTQRLPRESENLVRCILVADAGCELLRRVGPTSWRSNEVSGGEIIQHFLAQSTIDVVCVFSPVREVIEFCGLAPRWGWEAAIFPRQDKVCAAELEGLRRVTTALPPPQFEAHSARSLHRQGALAPQARGWWLPMEIREGHSGMQIRLSARALQEVLAGRVRLETAFDAKVFEAALKSGRTIKAARLEEGGIDADDDWVVLEFGPDIAAQKIVGDR